MNKAEKMRETRERAKAIKLTHQHFQPRKNPPVARTVSFENRRAA